MRAWIEFFMSERGLPFAYAVDNLYPAPGSIADPHGAKFREPRTIDNHSCRGAPLELNTSFRDHQRVLAPFEHERHDAEHPGLQAIVFVRYLCFHAHCPGSFIHEGRDVNHLPAKCLFWVSVGRESNG